MRSPKVMGTLIMTTALVSWTQARAATHNFNIPAKPLLEALALYQKQTGIGVVAPGGATSQVMLSAVKGKMDDKAALQALLAHTALRIERLSDRSAVLGAAPDIKTKARTGINDIENTFVLGHRTVQAKKRSANVVVDSIAYDPFENLGGNSSIASSLILLPGVTGIVDADEPRYVSVRGIAPDLNQTTFDGITMATIGQSGSGTRQVNLQDTPAEMTTRTDVFKSFTAEQQGEAIGAIIDMVPMSAFNHKGLYKYLDAYGIYSTFGGAAGHSGQSGYARHWGEGVKGTISDTFGKNNEFGLVLSMRYQDRVRNSTKNWYAYQYFDPKGKSVSAPVPGGSMGPSAYNTAPFQNNINTIGGSGRFEWKPEGTGLHASLMGWSYARWERSTMDQQQYYLKTAVRDQTDTGGQLQDNSLYLKRRQDQWHRQNSGVIADVNWKKGLSDLTLRGGYTWETYDNYEPYLQARTYPSNIWTTYAGDPRGNGYVMTGLSKNFQSAAQYNLSSATQRWDHAWEGVPTARLDYNYNTAPSAHGFGVAAGFEWRQLTITDNVRQTIYNTGNDMTSYVLNTGVVPWGNVVSTPLLNTPFNYPWNTLKINNASSTYYSRISNYKYRENITDGYVSLHYKLRNTVFIAGVRADNADYSGWTPTVTNGVASQGFVRSNGAYINPLPSFDIVHHFPHEINVHASYSQTIGRPTPGNIAQAANVTCNQDTVDVGGAQCTLSMGNPNLKPRRSKNFDISVDKFFNRNNGMVSLAFFDKWISDDIYTLRTDQIIGGTPYAVTKPMNASGSTIKGLEFSVMNRGMRLWGQFFDASANATWLQGHMRYSNGTQEMTTNHLIYQPDVLVNGALTWHIPAIKGALRTTLTYSGKYLTALGTQPYQNSGFGSMLSLNLGFWHQVYDHITLKYEVMNLANQQPTWKTGDHLQYTSERDNYGRAVYFHVIVN